ncbi:unnamed protein product, partial [marine sediment metagenome]
GILSTGRDGEPFDAFTGASKPRIYASQGIHFATTEQSLTVCEAQIESCEGLDYTTSMGKVIIARVAKPGAIEVAGPVSVDQCLDVIKRLREKYKVDTILIDGSINRMAITTSRLKAGVILATGAALGDMEYVIRQTQLKVTMMQTRCVNAKIKELLTENAGKGSALLIDRNLSVTTLPASLLHNVKDIAKAIADNAKYLYTDGAVSDLLIEHLLEKGKSLEIIVEDASKIYVTEQEYKKWMSCGGHLTVKNKVNLLAVTCNPYNPTGQGFEPKRFLKTMRSRLNVPVYDVMMN